MSEFDQRFFDAHYGDTQPIALIGAGCRFAGAADPFAFWRRLADGEALSRPVTRQDLASAGFDPAMLDEPGFVPVASVVEEAEAFDATFFGYSPGEAASIDPQQRLFLTCAWEALEMGGLAAGRASAPASERIGVFGSARMSTYLLPTRGDVLELASPLTFQRLIGNDKDYLASRVAYKLGLSGPAMTIQTACSSSLVAVHVACEQLRSGECDLALAGGAALTFPMEAGYRHRPGMIFSADGQCRPFDAQADGTFVGNGVAVVLLKPLRRALEDGDPVIAVLRGSAVNNDGGDKAGYTAPSLAGQRAVIEEAMALSGVTPDEIGMVETHGTGTPLGDPIEVEALTQAFGAPAERHDRCALGALKANTGHLDTAAGVAALLKAAFAVREGQIPPLLHFRVPNPALRLDETPFAVPQTLSPWTAKRRVAGVSSFGIGGTNCHAIVECLPPELQAVETAPDADVTLVLSAPDEAGLRALAGRHANMLLDGMPDSALPAYAATLAAARSRFPHRLAVKAPDAVELAAMLRDVAEVGDGAESVAVERDGDRIAWGLGVSPGVLSDLARADGSAVFFAASGPRAIAPVVVLRGEVHRAETRDSPVVDRWKDLAGAARSAGRARATAYDWSGLPDEERGVSALHAHYVARAFADLSVFAASSARLDRDAVMRAGRIPERFRDLVGRLLRDLAAAGCLTRDGDRFGDLREPANVDVEQLLDGMRGRGYLRLADLVARTGPHLAGMLTGRDNPVSIVFPGGASDDVEEMYERQRDSLYLNAVAADAVSAFVAGQPAGAPIRVLEIGAGTGGTTSAILPALPRDRTSYTFTDIGPLFLRRAEQKFADYPFLRFTTFDLEKDTAEQGLAAGTFDLIVAANVVHNARDLKATLARIRALLAPGGVLLLREITKPKPLFDFVFGALVPELDDSTFRDGELFPSLARWGEALTEAGFAHWTAAVGDDQPPFALGEQILLAGQPERSAAPRRPTPARDAPEALDAAAILAVLIEGQGDGPWAVEDITIMPRRHPGSMARVEDAGRIVLREEAKAVPLAIARRSRGRLPGLDSPTSVSLTEAKGDLRDSLAGALSAASLDGPLAIGAIAFNGTDLGNVSAFGHAQRPDGRTDIILADRDGYPVLRLLNLSRRGRAAAALHCWTWQRLDPVEPAAAAAALTFDGARSPTAERLGLKPQEASRTGAIPQGARAILDISSDPPAGPSGYARLLETLPRLTEGGGGVDVLTAGAVSALPGDRLERPDLAGLVGLIRVMRRERPNLDIRLVDSDAPLAALPGVRAGEDVIARRAGLDFAPRLVPLHGSRNGLPFDTEALQIITGGLSPLALTLAESLAARGARRISLLSRRPAEAAERHRIDLMRGGGTDVRLLADIDVGDPAALGRALDAACAEGDRIGSICHLAGTLEDGPLGELDAPRLGKVLSAKVEGARTILAALPRLRPESVLLFSSAATVFGPPGQGAHAIANAALEGLAEQAVAEGWPVKALAWGYWEDGRSNRGDLARRLSEQGMLGLDPKDGLTLLDIALAQPEAVLAPMRVDWDRLAGSGTLPNALAAFQQDAPPRDAATERHIPAPFSSGPSIAAHLRQALGGLLKVDPAAIDGGANLVTLGLDSLMFLEFSQGLKRDLGIDLSAEAALSYDTLDKLAAHLEPLAAPERNHVAATLRHELAALLRRPESELDLACNLVQLGMDSLIFLELSERIERSLGIRISAETALQHDTLGRLAAAIEAQIGAAPQAGVQVDPLRHALADAGAGRPGLLLDNGDLRPDPAASAFDLSPFQRSGFDRRAGGRLGGTARHMYVEYDKPAEFDLIGFERAWNRVIARHPTLRTEIEPDGTCRVLPSVPPLRIECEDVRPLDPDARRNRLLALRERMSHQRLDLAMWPHFELRATRIDDDTVRLHLDIDTTLVDIESFQVILREIDVDLRQKGRELPPLSFTPADYRRGARLVEERAPAPAAAAAPPPDLPLDGGLDALPAIRFEIRREALAREAWLQIRERGEASELSASAVLLAAFGAALAPWLGAQSRFALGLAYFDRKPLHAEVMNLVLDASAAMPVTLDVGDGQSFAGLAASIQAQVDGHLAKGSFDTAPLRLPVVFTTLLGLRKTYALPESADPTLGMPTYEYAAQPGCVLHAQALEEQRELLFNFDWVGGLLPDLAGEALTIAFGAVLGSLARAPEIWQAPLSRLSPADPEISAFRAEARQTLAPAWQGGDR